MAESTGESLPKREPTRYEEALGKLDKTGPIEISSVSLNTVTTPWKGKPSFNALRFFHVPSLAPIVTEDIFSAFIYKVYEGNFDTKMAKMICYLAHQAAPPQEGSLPLSRYSSSDELKMGELYTEQVINTGPGKKDETRPAISDSLKKLLEEVDASAEAEGPKTDWIEKAYKARQAFTGSILDYNIKNVPALIGLYMWIFVKIALKWKQDIELGKLIEIYTIKRSSITAGLKLGDMPEFPEFSGTQLYKIGLLLNNNEAILKTIVYSVVNVYYGGVGLELQREQWKSLYGYATFTMLLNAQLEGFLLLNLLGQVGITLDLPIIELITNLKTPMFLNSIEAIIDLCENETVDTSSGGVQWAQANTEDNKAQTELPKQNKLWVFSRFFDNTFFSKFSTSLNKDLIYVLKNVMIDDNTNSTMSDLKIPDPTPGYKVHLDWIVATLKGHIMERIILINQKVPTGKFVQEASANQEAQKFSHSMTMSTPFPSMKVNQPRRQHPPTSDDELTDAFFGKKD
ncbi:hypothetical protein 1 [Hubei myriapoda virus 7]|uniref:hypothetical protein 1 n=1 Tax=Hubei myriapoda virus 7 TaxID=1922936 RepID=UPI00090B58A8|nr:hypothetical protein 1 [Hubei myriapoda virus 7]APG78790.1 hypothetical protein 1 [Hubei myriapoda virus 7]